MAALKAPAQLPTDEAIRTRFLDLAQLTERDPMGARELFRRLFKGGALRMTPGADGSYTVTGDVFWSC